MPMHLSGHTHLQHFDDLPIKEADEKGILMVSAAGNQGGEAGTSTVEYPAAYEDVFSLYPAANSSYMESA